MHACVQIPEDPGYLSSGVYELLATGALPPSHPDHPVHGGRSARGVLSASIASDDDDVAASSTVAGTSAGSGSARSPSPKRSRRGAGAAAGSPGASASVQGSMDGGGLLFDGVALTTSGLRLGSAHMLAHGQEPPLTTRTPNFAGCLDYIWVSHASVRVEATLGLPYAYKIPAAAGAGGTHGSTNGQGTHGSSTSPSGSSSPARRENKAAGKRVHGGDQHAAAYPYRDPMRDVAFSPIPDDAFPSDHLAVGCVLSLRDPS